MARRKKKSSGVSGLIGRKLSVTGFLQSKVKTNILPKSSKSKISQWKPDTEESRAAKTAKWTKKKVHRAKALNRLVKSKSQKEKATRDKFIWM